MAIVLERVIQHLLKCVVISFELLAIAVVVGFGYYVVKVIRRG